jgi:hypothetical protein
MYHCRKLLDLFMLLVKNVQFLSIHGITVSNVITFVLYPVKV